MYIPRTTDYLFTDFINDRDRVEERDGYFIGRVPKIVQEFPLCAFEQKIGKIVCVLPEFIFGKRSVEISVQHIRSTKSYLSTLEILGELNNVHELRCIAHTAQKIGLPYLRLRDPVKQMFLQLIIKDNYNVMQE